MTKKENNILYYHKKIEELISNNKYNIYSLNLEWKHVAEYDKNIAIWIYECPDIVLPILNETLFSIINKM